MKRVVLFVLGMGRSGSSALARVLSLCGASLPQKLVPGHESNPTGHWEPIEALELNDSFLHRHGSNWFDPTLRIQNELSASAQEVEAFIAEIGSLLESWPGGDVLVIKEPRITALSRFWFEAVRRVGAEIKVILPVRHPWEVSASLVERDQMSVELSVLLWLKYNLLGERHSRGIPRVFVEYSNLLANWGKEVNRIARTLSVDLSLTRAREIEAFLSHDLYHQRQTRDQIDDVGPFPIAKLYHVLANAARDEPLDFGMFDAATHTYTTCERLFRRGLTEFHSQFGPMPTDGPLITKTARERDALAAALSQHKAAIEWERTSRVAERARANQTIEELRVQLEAVLASSSWKLTRPLRALRQVSSGRWFSRHASPV